MTYGSPDHVRVKDNNSRRALYLNEISELAADCLFWWNKGMSRQIREFLMPFAEDALGTGLFKVIGDNNIHSEKSILDRIDEVSQTWSDTLCNPLDRSAYLVGRRLCGMLETWRRNTEREFWRGHLGQLVFYRDGFPMRHPTIGEAQAILCTRKSAIDVYLEKGKLREVHNPAPTTIAKLIDRNDLIALWEERTGLKVGNARLLRFGA